MGSPETRPLRRARSGLVWLAIAVSAAAGAGVTPPCGGDYGSNSARQQIQQAMLTGSASDVVVAIDGAKSLRGPQVGCPQLADVPRRLVSDTPPKIADLDRAWNLYVGGLPAVDLSCPRTGRELAPLALGAYWLNPLGRFDDLDSLAAIARMYIAEQYAAAVVDPLLVAPPGIYGYTFPDSEGDRCALRGKAGEAARFICTRFPDRCPRYRAGRFAGRRFAVADHVVVDGAMVGDPGGAAFDTGWIGVMLAAASEVETRPQLRGRFRASALLAGKWGLAQPLVTNHNYTAKVVWLLAQLYLRTGREDFRAGLIDRLERNLLPGVLMDREGDGWVDGVVPPVSFAALAPPARVPGRMWDGHNSLPWYQSMNAWAVLEAYVALRDRGDAHLAARLRPYAVAMLDNLAAEIVTLGAPAAQGPGWTDAPLALLLGRWKLARYEGESHPLWQRATSMLWHSGVFERRGPHGVNVALYLLLATHTPYAPPSPWSGGSSGAACPLPPGHGRYCRDCGPCAEGVGDCDSDAECQVGLECTDDVGAQLGFAPGVDVCTSLGP